MKAENLAFLDSVARQFSSLPIRLESILNRFHMHGWKLFRCVKAGFHMIADNRRSQKVLRSSAIIWKHTSAIACDRLRSCNRDRTRSQKIEPCSIFCDRLRLSAIICDRLRSCDHMETKVLRSDFLQPRRKALNQFHKFVQICWSFGWQICGVILDGYV